MVAESKNASFFLVYTLFLNSGSILFFMVFMGNMNEKMKMEIRTAITFHISSLFVFILLLFIRRNLHLPSYREGEETNCLGKLKMSLSSNGEVHSQEPPPPADATPSCNP